MVAHVTTVAFQGLDVLPIDVQVHMSSGLPSFKIVGLPDKAVGESKERVSAALHAIGLSLPPKRITVNLSPADLQKEGSHYDLPIALGLLVVMSIIPSEEMASFIALGELGLDGTVRHIAGILPTALHALSRDQGLICPAACGGEAAWAGDLDIIAAPDLVALVNHIKGVQILAIPEPKIAEHTESTLEFSEIKGQIIAKRALEVAAAGGHNLLMIGPPGAGKSMLASRLPGILPPLTPPEALEVSIIHSISGLLREGRLLRLRPFRAPHHSASLPALVGGGTHAKPGEVSLAHLGVLFLDELPEFKRTTLEALRQPLETGQVTIARANAHVCYPARVQLVAAMNPCRCGYLTDAERACSRAPRCAIDYQARISGPLLDRIDLHTEVPAVPIRDLAASLKEETTLTVAQRVARARQIQIKRYQRYREHSVVRTNAEADGKILKEVAPLDTEGQAFLLKACDKLKISARGYHRVIRVARTLADLEGHESVRLPHIAEALSYRPIMGRQL